MSDQRINSSELILQNPLCIGIGGVSRSGKTFLAELLQASISNSVIIHQDTFIPDESEIPRIKDHIDWERPEAIDWDRLKHSVETACNSGKTVIVEGLFAFNNAAINQYYSRIIYISLSKQEFISRKQSDLRWGKEPDWYINHIWESFEIHGRLPEEFNDALKLDGENDFDLNKILSYLTLQSGNAI